MGPVSSKKQFQTHLESKNEVLACCRFSDCCGCCRREKLLRWPTSKSLPATTDTMVDTVVDTDTMVDTMVVMDMVTDMVTDTVTVTVAPWLLKLLMSRDRNTTTETITAGTVTDAVDIIPVSVDTVTDTTTTKPFPFCIMTSYDISSLI